MEKRLAKINFSAAGGTASKGAQTCKVTLPTAWVEALGLKQESRDVELSFDGNTIILARPLSGQEFTTQKRNLGHLLRRIRFYDGDGLCTTIYADFTDETFVVENHIEDPVKTAFGNNPLPNWADLQAFFAGAVHSQGACRASRVSGSAGDRRIRPAENHTKNRRPHG